MNTMLAFFAYSGSFTFFQEAVDERKAARRMTGCCVVEDVSNRSNRS